MDIWEKNISGSGKFKIKIPEAEAGSVSWNNSEDASVARIPK